MADKIRTSTYETAGEAFAIDQLKVIEGRLEKKADLELFQIDMLLNLVTNSIAPLVLAAADPKLLFVYLPMKKILENMRDNKQRATLQHEQQEYAYGFPAYQEAEEEPEAFDFYR